MISKNKYYGTDFVDNLEEIENELNEFKIMFNEKSCLKMKKKEKKFKNKPAWDY